MEEIAASSGQLQIEGFISLVGAYTKVRHLPFDDRKLSPISGFSALQAYQFLCALHTPSTRFGHHSFLDINRHPISFCDLHRLIDNRFAASTFAKHVRWISLSGNKLRISGLLGV